MSNHEKLTAALLGVFEIDEHDKALAASALAGVLMAFADAVRGPAPVVAELAAVERVADPVQAELINEVRALIQEIRVERHEAGKGVVLACRPKAGCLCGHLPG